MKVKRMVILGFIKAMIGAIIMTAVCYMLFIVLTNIGVLKSANYLGRLLPEVKKQIEQNGFDRETLPDGYSYVLYDENNDFIEGNMDDKDMNYANFALEKGGCSGSEVIGTTKFKAFDIPNGKIVLKYSFKARYGSPILNKILPPPDYILIAIPFLSITLMLGLVAQQISNPLKIGVDTLIDAADKVGNQDLSFELSNSKIYEINALNKAFKNMGNTLKNSLTQQWKMETERKEQISAIAHDVKTPLMLISGHSDLLLETEGLSDEQKGHINMILKGSEQISTLMKIMLEASEVGSQIKANRQSVNQSEFCEEMYRQSKALCELKDIDISFNVQEEMPKSLFFDRNLIERAMLNIIKNAVEFTPKDGRIDVSINIEDGYFIFEVHDNGKGFSEKDILNSTKQFYRGDSARKMNGHYGLGLYITDTAAKLHNGELIINNHKDGGGVVRLVLQSVV